MKTKVSEATPLQLDWLVAKANKIPLCLSPFTGSKQFVIVGQNGKPTVYRYEPTTSWAQGGPIIEREIEILEDVSDASGWAATKLGRTYYGPTPLIAAMLAFVASKLGDVVDVPEELT